MKDWKPRKGFKQLQLTQLGSVRITTCCPVIHLNQECYQPFGLPAVLPYLFTLNQQSARWIHIYTKLILPSHLRKKDSFHPEQLPCCVLKISLLFFSFHESPSLLVLSSQNISRVTSLPLQRSVYLQPPLFTFLCCQTSSIVVAN